LNKEHIRAIIDLTLNEMLDTIKDRNIQITLSDNVKEFLAEKGYDPVYGARQVKRVIRKYVEDPIAEEILKERFHDGSRIQVRKKKDGLEYAEMDKSSKSGSSRVKSKKKVDSK
jgi:ATP-dependent Clp protease ATP-binding subunit ClpC